MGCGNSQTNLSPEEEKRMKSANQNIVSAMHNAERVDHSQKKLLLLGTGSSGKSTLFKNLKIISTKPDDYDNSVLTESRHVIRQNIVAGILTILKKSQELHDLDPDKNSSCIVSMDDDIVGAIQMIVNYGSESFTEALDYSEVSQLGECIEKIWKLDSVQATFARRGSNYSFPDNMDYFFDKVCDVMQENYLPSTEDMLRARVRTTGIVRFPYQGKEGNKFIIFDVGGQRNERKKWIHSFEGVSAVLFVMALNHYNAVLFEDEKKNAMHEAVELFTEICNSKWFRKSEMILLLNKDDLFRRKLLLQIYLNVCFTQEKGWDGIQWDGPNYEPTGDDDADADEQLFNECYDEAIKFIQNIFISRNKIPNRVVFCHVTCATDGNTVEKVFWDVQNIVIRSNLRRGGLMV